MSVAELLKQRTSIRAFLNTPVEESVVREILDQARWSPSGGNLQPWKVIAVAGEEKRAIEQMATMRVMMNPQGEAGDYPIYPANLQEPYRSRRYQVGEEMYEILGIGREDKMGRMQSMARNFQFFGAPVGLFLVIDKSMGNGQWAHVGMFMQSIALLAQERGLSTCMQEAWAMVRESLHSHFQLPDNEVVYCAISLGYKDPDAPVNTYRSSRAAVDEFASFKGF